MSKPLILCIDDEALGLQIRRMMLERAGYRVITATDGTMGLTAFADEPVDAVVLDYLMPEMNGGEVAAAMRLRRPEVPILLLSAYINLPSEVLGVVDCAILKGDAPEILLTKLQELLMHQSKGIDGEVFG